MRDYEKYIRYRTFPTPWCPGCGDGVILKSIAMAFAELNLDPDDIIVIAGIGCSGRMPTYFNTNTLHTTHGRALTFATGIKLAKPEKLVVVISGDGDATAIGGNHLIHAARRNVNVTALVFNNSIYGMTGGQTSPATHVGDRSTTSAYGNIEPAFDICELARAAGATYVARGTPLAYRQLVQVIAGGIVHEGFSMVEAMSICPVYYGRFNLTPDPAEFLLGQKERAVPADKFEAGESRSRDRYPVGVLYHTERDELIAGLEKIRKLAQDGRDA